MNGERRFDGHRRTAALVVLGFALGCGGRSSHDAGDDVRACDWPEDLTFTDPNATCESARHAISCTDGNETLTCLSDAPGICRGVTPEELEPTATCSDVCGDTEYALFCVAAPFAPTQAGCRRFPPQPGGMTLLCCPCGA